MAELPYQAEYAKSGRAACKGCKEKIDQGSLRIAVMVQSAFHDGKQPNWHHEECFFRKQRPTTFTDISNFNKLKHADQTRLKTLIENNTGIVLPDDKSKAKGKGKKRAADNGEASNAAIKDFRVEYAKSSRASCRHCDIKICKDEVRICKVVFDTEIGSKYGGQPLWHHVKCFAEERNELLYFAGGESLPGIKMLSPEDQKMVINEIKPLKGDDIPVKKLKEEPKDAAELKEEKNKEKKMEKQNKLFHKHRKALSELKKNDLQELLEYNSQEIPSGQDECLDRLADIMAFGALEPCPECKQGQLVLDTFGYKCTGNTTAWTKCSYVTQDPKRMPMKVPKTYKDGSIFKKYKPKTDVRLFMAAPRPALVIMKKEAPSSSQEKKNVPIPPLKNLQFFLYGRIKDKEELKKRILKLGGLVTSKLTDTLVAVVSTKKEIENMNDKMHEIQDKDIEVVEPSFFDLIDAEGTIAKTLQLVKENNIADWGSDPATRIPQDVLDGKSIAKSGSNYASTKSASVKLKIKEINRQIAVRQLDTLYSPKTVDITEENRNIQITSCPSSSLAHEQAIKVSDNLSCTVNACGDGTERPDQRERLYDEGGRESPNSTISSVASVPEPEQAEEPLSLHLPEFEFKVVASPWEELVEAAQAEEPRQDEPEVIQAVSSPNRSLFRENRISGTAVDPDSQLEDVAHVYRDHDGTKYTVTLCQTDVVAQKNSYYKLQVLEKDDNKKWWLFRSWGRIGTTIGGNKLEDFKSPEAAIDKFEHYYMEKTENPWECRDMFMKVAGKYYPLDVEYGDEAESQPRLQVDSRCAIPAAVQQLVITIFDIDVMKKTLLEFDLDTEKMPLGKLSKKQIKSGYKVLAELLKYIEKGTANQSKIIDATNRFFTLVPHNFGRDNAPLLNDVELIKSKTEMLDNLLEIEIAYSLMKTEDDESVSPIESHYKKLKAELAPLARDSDDFRLVQEYTANTHAHTHSSYTLDVQQVFKVVREGEDKRYKPFKKLHNRRLLWHGSRVTNFAGILSQGLRIAPPEAPVTGYMFGKGIYFADMVSKSANYCCTNKSNPTGLLLLCEVALGDMKECYKAENVKLPADKHSAWGVGRTQPAPGAARALPCGTLVPLGPPVATQRDTTLLYNEFIVYDVAQVKVKYLVQMKFNHKY